MSVINIAFELEPEIVEGLATGMYKLWGGVIRDQAGHIVRHLPEALSAIEASQVPVQAAASAVSTATKAVAKTSIPKKVINTTVKKTPSLFGSIGHFATAHPVGTAIAGVSIAGLAVYGIYRWAKSKSEQKAAMEKAPAYIEHFNAALDTYYSALQGGTLNKAIVEDLISAIEDMSDAVANGVIKMEFSAEQVSNMLGILSFYTREFANANHYEYSEPAKPKDADACSNLMYFKDYLKIQRSIYQAA